MNYYTHKARLKTTIIHCDHISHEDVMLEKTDDGYHLHRDDYFGKDGVYT